MKQFHHAWDVHLYVEKRLSALPALCRSTHDTEMSSLLALEFAVYCVFFYVWFKSLFHVLNVQGRSMYGHGYRKLPLKRPCVCLKCCNNKYRLDSSNLHTLHCHIQMKIELTQSLPEIRMDFLWYISLLILIYFYLDTIFLCRSFIMYYFIVLFTEGSEHFL